MFLARVSRTRTARLQRQKLNTPHCSAGSTSYRKAAGETTEWDDIQKKFGNGPPEPEKPAVVEEVEEDHSLEAQFEGASAAAMAEAIEDGGLAEDEEDELEAIRRRRIEQLKEKAKREKVRTRLFPQLLAAPHPSRLAPFIHSCASTVRASDAAYTGGLQGRSE